MRDLARTYCTWKEWICSACKKTPLHSATFTMQRFDALPCPDQVSPLFSLCTLCQLLAPVTCGLRKHESCRKRERNQLCVHEWDTRIHCCSQTSWSASTDITATNKNKNTCERTVGPPLPALTHSISIQEHPPHLPTRWRTAERKLRRRQIDRGDGAPLQVTLSQAGRWESHTNGSRRQELESVFFCHGYKLAWALRGTIGSSREKDTVASETAISTKPVTSRRVSSADPIKSSLSSWHEFPP